MLIGNYCFADIPVRIITTYPYLHDRCARYKTNSQPQLEISVTQEDIDFEREMTQREAQAEKIPFHDFPNEVYEFTAAYRKLVEAAAYHDIFLMHGSAIAVDGKAFIFTAKSGTGKSTHSRLWRDFLGERAVMINDDKPLLRVDPEDSGSSSVTIYGTPWDGKHHLSTNTKAPLAAICILERAAENRIRKTNAYEVLPFLLQQIYRPRSADALKRVMLSAYKAIETVPVYKLSCNMDISAAKTAYAELCSPEQQN